MSSLVSILLLLLLSLFSAQPATAPAPGSDAGSPKPAEEQPFFISAGQPKCPDVADLSPTDPDDYEALTALAPKMIAALYTDPGYEEFSDLSVSLAADAGIYGEMVTNMCGAEVAKSTWVISVAFPQMAPSASLSTGQFMVTKTQQGWSVWLRYH